MDAPALVELEPAKGDVARLRLLQAALPVIAERGIEGATVRDIAEAAGQNVAAVSYYFGGKEELYLELMRGLVRELRARIGALMGEAQERLRKGDVSPDEAGKLLGGLVRAHYLTSISRTDSAPIARLIYREQTCPTAAFDILFSGAVGEFHELLTDLTAIATECDRDGREAKVRTHAIVGQMLGFVMARETALRRLGWPDLEGERAEYVADVLVDNLQILLRGARAQRRVAARRNRKRGIR